MRIVLDPTGERQAPGRIGEAVGDQPRQRLVHAAQQLALARRAQLLDDQRQRSARGVEVDLGVARQHQHAVGGLLLQPLPGPPPDGAVEGGLAVGEVEVGVP